MARFPFLLLLNNILLCIYITFQELSNGQAGEILFKNTNLQLVDKEVLGI